MFYLANFHHKERIKRVTTTKKNYSHLKLILPLNDVLIGVQQDHCGANNMHQMIGLQDYGREVSGK